jgi:ribosome-binding protein aMBF1 (putative translation factor)
MSKAKREPQPAPPAHEGKGFLALAGEAFAVLGEEIVEGKDKVVEVAAAQITAVKKAIKKITHKKAARPSKSVKKKAVKKTPAKKAPAKKVVSATKKVVKKAKSVAKKAVKKKAPPRRK